LACLRNAKAWQSQRGEVVVKEWLDESLVDLLAGQSTPRIARRSHEETTSQKPVRRAWTPPLC